MAPTRFYLREDVDPLKAVESLRSLAIQANNLLSLGSDVRRLREGYLDWVEMTRGQLENWTADPNVLGMLETTGYWAIRNLDEDTPRPWPLIRGETDLQAGALKRLADDLEGRMAAFSFSADAAILDSNLLLHYEPIDKLPWLDIVGSTTVHLVLPLRVIEELDAKKYSGSVRLAKRARRLLPQLETIIREKGGVISPSVTIGVAMESGERIRPSDADEEILHVSLELEHLSGKRVTVITGDTSMLMRAESLKLRAVKMPEKYLRQSDD
jgi:hypothetical protein